jgi:hypothetical protein
MQERAVSVLRRLRLADNTPIANDPGPFPPRRVVPVPPLVLQSLRVAARSSNTPDASASNIGFRVVRGHEG